MMRSMFSGVSSLRVHQTRMDVIANNIANVNTDGFKAQRATFADAFYQNLQGASGPDPTFGRSGTNPRQVGLGLNLASIDNLMHQGIARRTDNALDVAIEGNGFFIVEARGGGNIFTRTGRIERDAHWNLHIGGNMLMGWSTTPCANTPGGHAVNRGLLQPLSLSGEKQSMPSEPTTMVNFEGNLNINQLSYNAATGEHYRIIPKTIYDSLGNRYEISVRFVYHADVSAASESPRGYWTMEMVTAMFHPDTGLPGTPPTGATDWTRGVLAFREGNRDYPVSLGICLFGSKNVTPATGGGFTADAFRDGMITSATLSFDSNGNLIGMGRTAMVEGRIVPQRFLPGVPGANVASWTDAPATAWMTGNQFDINIIPLRNVAPSATFGDTGTGRPASTYAPGGVATAFQSQIALGTISLNFEDLGQRGRMATTVRALYQNGGGPGTLTDISVGPDGTIMGRFSNGRDRILGQIPLAFFSNPAGLERIGNSFWQATANSGPFDGVGLVGQMIGGALEGSNVDLASEFTEMITTQRGFQAASRTITVSDEMIQELVNLRR